jgi:hypothetical protein
LCLIIVSCDDSKEPSAVKPSTDGLVSYYKFQGNSEDSFGENDGTDFNALYSKKVPAKSEKVLALNGVNSYIDLTTPFDYESMSISVWFNAHEIESVFDLIYTSDNPELDYGLLSIAVRNDDGVDNLYFNVSGQNVTVPIEKDQWYHVVIAKDKKAYRYYLDNTLVVAGTFENYLTSAQGMTTAIVGCVRTLEGGFLNGLVDELRIYNRPVTEGEVKILFFEKYSAL